MLPANKFDYRTGLRYCDIILCVSHTVWSAFESIQETKIVPIFFRAAFDLIQHGGILLKLCSVGIGGTVLSVRLQFLSNQS